MPTFKTPVYAGRVTSASTITVPVPGDLADGDLLIVALRSQDTGANPWVAPEGFILVSADQAVPDAGARVGAVFVKSIEESTTEPASYNFTGPINRAVAIAVGMTPDALYAPIVRVVQSAYGGGVAPANGIMTIPDRNLTSAPAIALVANGAELTSGIAPTSHVKPEGFTEIGTAQSSMDMTSTGSRTAIWLGWRAEPDAVANGYAVGFTGASSSGTYYAAFIGDGRTPVEPEEPEEPAVGFRSVAQMLSTPGATWAHRGGSLSWPEMSELAYSNSAQAGYGALEFSAARTSDGVWFGLHDASINRTSGTTGLPDASAMTWAEIQTHTNTSNGGSEPYYRMDDFLAEYGQSHVVIVDCKYAIPHLDEFFTVLATADRKRVVVKAFGTMFDAPNIASRVRTYGFSSWGYYYPAQVADGSLASTQHHWSILGMDYTGTQADWDAVLSYGKPVTGHIAPTLTAYNTAISKGARMVQCSGVSVIPAVGPVEGTQPWDAIYAQGSRIPASHVRLGTTQVWP